MSEIKEFKLGTILSVTTGYNLTKKNMFGDVHELFWHVYNDDLINDTGILMCRDEMKNHLLTIHPELKEVKYKKGTDTERFVLKQEKKFGKVLPITRLGEDLPQEYKHR